MGLHQEDLHTTAKKQPLLLVKRTCEGAAHLPALTLWAPTHIEAMGTLVGHLLPGMFFLLYSLYYSVLVSLLLLRGRKFYKPPLPPREKRGHRWWQQVPVEGVVKVVITMTGIMPEFFYPLGSNQLQIID